MVTPPPVDPDDVPRPIRERFHEHGNAINRVEGKVAALEILNERVVLPAIERVEQRVNEAGARAELMRSELRTSIHEARKASEIGQEKLDSEIAGVKDEVGKLHVHVTQEIGSVRTDAAERGRRQLWGIVIVGVGMLANIALNVIQTGAPQ